MDLSENEKYWYWLASAPKIGLQKVLRVIQDGVELSEIFCDPAKIDFEKCKIPLDAQKNLLSRAHLDVIEAEIAALAAQEVQICTPIGKSYPPSLKEIHSPPALLYVKGDLDRLTQKCISIVGSRKASRKGMANIRSIARELAENGVSVISGMARGIDTAAHTGALEGGGVTVAVLGCGVDIVYPRENREIYEKICKTGAVVSEYAPGTPPVSGNFPVRNRIMNGISRGVLVGDAGIKSGAHITVRFACEENRDIFALPSEANAEAYELPNLLIAEGAYVCRHGQDILDFYGWESVFGCKEEGDFPSGLDFFEAGLYNLLLKGDMNMQQIVDAMREKPQRVNLTLTKMELRGLIERSAGNIFGIKN